MNLAYTISDPNIGTEVSSGKKENELPFKKKKINKSGANQAKSKICKCFIAYQAIKILSTIILATLDIFCT